MKGRPVLSTTIIWTKEGPTSKITAMNSVQQKSVRKIIVSLHTIKSNKFITLPGTRVNSAKHTAARLVNASTRNFVPSPTIKQKSKSKLSISKLVIMISTFTSTKQFGVLILSSMIDRLAFMLITSKITEETL